jgi:hypothetical protein
MTTTAKRLGKGIMSDSEGNLDASAVGSGQIRFVKAITLCNTSIDPVDVTIKLAGTTVIYEYTLEGVGGENSITIPFLDQIMEELERITGYASVTNVVHYYISGREV